MDTTERARLIRAGDRRALARAITLVESARPDHRAEALALIDASACLRTSSSTSADHDGAFNSSLTNSIKAGMNSLLVDMLTANCPDPAEIPIWAWIASSLS